MIIQIGLQIQDAKKGVGLNFPILQMFAFVIQVAIHINSQWDADCNISLETQVLQQLKILEPE